MLSDSKVSFIDVLRFLKILESICSSFSTTISVYYLFDSGGTIEVLESQRDYSFWELLECIIIVFEI